MAGGRRLGKVNVESTTRTRARGQEEQGTYSTLVPVIHRIAASPALKPFLTVGARPKFIQTCWPLYFFSLTKVAREDIASAGEILWVDAITRLPTRVQHLADGTETTRSRRSSKMKARRSG